MAKSRQSNAIMTFMAHNDFARFARIARKRRNEKQGILEKSCQNPIFIISYFNGGHRNGKKSSEQRHNDVHGSQLLCSLRMLCRRRRNEKQGILEKSCENTIFIISNFNEGHRNGKKSFLPAV
jgi:uncharacterized protein Veg